MLTWEEIVDNYIIRHSDTVRRVTAPLHDHFGLTYFTYHRITDAGHYRVLVDRPDMALHYISEGLYRSDPYLRRPSNFHSGLSLLGDYGDSDVIKKGFQTYDTLLDADMGVLLIDRQPGWTDFFGFAGRTQTSALPSLYQERPHLLRAFASHFLTSLSPLLSRMSEEPIDLPTLKGADYYHSEPLFPPLDPRPFLRDIGLGHYVDQAALLTPRERQCLRHLLSFETSKETAAALSLSPRTVESYLDNIRDKLFSPHKKALFDLATRLHQLGLL